MCDECKSYGCDRRMDEPTCPCACHSDLGYERASALMRAEKAEKERDIYLDALKRIDFLDGPHAWVARAALDKAKTLETQKAE